MLSATNQVDKIIFTFYDYLHDQKNTNVRSNGQIWSFSVQYICQMESWSVLDMMFVMYQRYNYWNFIIGATDQLDKLIFIFLGFYMLIKKKKMRSQDQFCSFSVHICMSEGFLSYFLDGVCGVSKRYVKEINYQC